MKIYQRAVNFSKFSSLKAPVLNSPWRQSVYVVAMQGKNCQKTETLNKFSQPETHIPIPHPIIFTAKFGTQEYNHCLRLPAIFHLSRFIMLFCHPWRVKNAKAGPIFNFIIPWRCHVMVQRWLNVGAQLQTFPNDTISKLFMSSNSLIAMSHSQTLLLKNEENKKQTSIWHRVKSHPELPNSAWWYRRSITFLHLKMSSHPIYSFAASWGAGNLGKMHLNFKLP